ncbi:hypothetical protein KJ359_002361 [Pestalotiopsis sp. 9143b]|nr:hypothetical protein KJ359_002361 [Pestalotiopsis sp. 9143b]
MSKLRECTHRVIPICGAVLVTFSLGGGLGYTVNGKPLPRDAVVGVSIAFLVLGALFGAGCLRLYICRRAQDNDFDLEKASPDPDRSNVGDLLERGQAVDPSPPPPVHRTIGRREQGQGQGRRERAGNQEGFDMFGSYAEQESTVAPEVPDQQRAVERHQEPPETPTPRPRPAPFSWERRSGLLDPTRRKTLRVQNAPQNPPQSTPEGSEHTASRDEAPSDGPSTNVPRRTQIVRRREPPHQRNDSAATIRAHNFYAAPLSEDDGRLMHDIVALTGMPKTQANLRDGGEPILPRSSSLKRTGSAKKAGPGNKFPVFGSKSTVSRSSTQRSHSQVSGALGVGPYERRAKPTKAQPSEPEPNFEAWHPNMSNSSVNHDQNPSAEASSSKQKAEPIAKAQGPGQELGRSLTARRIDGWQEDNVGTTQIGGWI